MTILEHISLFQRVLGSLKDDMSQGKLEKAIGKADILQGELDIMRSTYEEAMHPEQIYPDAPQEDFVQDIEEVVEPTEVID